jgi:cytoskeletal protein RodZ
MNGCAIAAIIGAGILGLVILLGIIVAVFSTSSDNASDKPRPAGSPRATTTPTTAPATTQPVEKAPVTVTAKATTFSPSVLHNGTTVYTSVKVTVTNGGETPTSINPLYFTITDTSGTKHTAELGVDDQQIATVDLAPGENITGVITGKGKFVPKYVTYTNGLFGDGIRGNVG